MRVGELSRRSGVSVPTIKYYLRENLLAPGTAVAVNQAVYTDRHLRRLRLIRSLIDVAGLSIVVTREVLSVVDGPAPDPCGLLAAADRALGQPRRPMVDDAVRQAAADEAAALVARRQWNVPAHARALDRLADIIATLRSLSLDDAGRTLDVYADAAADLAEHDVALLCPPGEPAARRSTPAMEAAAASAMLGEALFAALHRLALFSVVAARGSA